MLAATVEPGFAEAVGMTQPIRLRVEHATAGVLAEGEIDLPFAVVGSHPECEISLNDPSLPGRAAALQVIDGRVVLFPFQSLTPTPLAADVTWRVGEFNVSWTNDQVATPNFDPLRPVSTSPRVLLDHRTDGGKVEAIPLTRRIGFIGRSLGCAVRFDAADVADVHAYLLMAGNEVWVIDLLSASGTWVNDRRVRTARLRDGDDLRIGSRMLTVRYDLWGEVLPNSREPGSEVREKPEPVSPVSQPTAEEESTDLVPLTPAPVVPALPTVAIPPQGDPNTVALFQYVAAMQGQMMAEFRQTMDDAVSTIGRMHQQQMEAMRTELNRLAELNSELQKLQLPVPAPLSLPAPSPAAALYQSIPDLDELPPMTEESASRHQWVAARLAEIEAERGGIWNRIRGMFTKSTQAV